MTGYTSHFSSGNQDLKKNSQLHSCSDIDINPHTQLRGWAICTLIDIGTQHGFGYLLRIAPAHEQVLHNQSCRSKIHV